MVRRGGAGIMADFDFIDIALLGLAAFMAGTVDAVIGGGGMIQVPALFALFPGALPSTLFGTNKVASLAGTGGAAVQYARAMPPPARIMIPAAIGSMLFAALGAYAVLSVPAEPLRKALPIILVALLAYTLTSRSGLAPRDDRDTRHDTAIAASGGSIIGFYDGFLGPGTGAFFKVLFVRGLGFSFLGAAAPSKIANVASNIGALAVFITWGKVLWAVALFLAVLNFAGGQLGSRAALRYGSGFIRTAFIVVVSLLIVKTFHDAYLR